MQLQQWKPRFAQMGVAVAATTTDRPKLLRKFAEKFAVDYPVLYDAFGKNARKLGVQNREYDRGHNAYGVPHPGVLFVDSSGVVRAKAAERGFRKRPEFPDLYRLVASTLAESAE